MPRRPTLIAWLLLTPLLLWLAVFVVAPTLVMFVYSFGERDDLGGLRLFRDVDGTRQFVGNLDNYRRVLASRQLTGVTVAAVAAAVVALAARFTLGGRRLRLRGTLLAFIAVFWLLLCGIELHWFDLGRFVQLPEQTQDSPWLKVLVVSVNYAAASTAICLVAGYPVAYFIGRSSERWRGLLLMGVMIPFWTSFLIRTYAWVTIFRSEGVLNNFLMWLGVIAAPLDLYPSQTAVMVGLVYTYLPFMILPIFTSIEKLDGSLIEAALDLGATPTAVFRNVILPLTKPGIVAGVMLVFVPAVGMFAVNNILGGGSEMLIGNAIENQFGKAGNKPFGAALSMLLLVIFVATYFFATRRKADAA